jgi:hypothetical protein
METHSREKSIDLESWAESHAQQFAAGETPPLPDDWSDLRDALSGQFRNGSLTNDLDMGQLYAALAWATDLDQAADEGERRFWLHLHRQAILCATYRIEYWARLENEETDVGESERKNPYKDEQRLIERIAKIVARLNPGEPHEELWQSIFALGADAPEWIQHFVSRWLLEAAGPEQPANALIEQWIAMLDFAENCEAWKKKKRGFRNLSDAWKNLLGLSPFSADFWRPELEPAIKAVRPYFERWALPRMKDSYRVRTILYFLQTQAAVSLRIDFLIALRQRVPLDDDYFWDDASTRN